MMTKRALRGLIVCAMAAGCQPDAPPAPLDAASDLGADIPTVDITAETAVDADAPAEAAVDVAADVDTRPRCPMLPDQPEDQTGGLCDDANITDITDTIAAGRHHLGWVNAPRRSTTQLLVEACSERGGVRAKREVMLRYRMRTTAYLRVSTDNLGSHCGPEGVKNTFVGVFRACRPGDRTVALGCNTDAAYDMAGPSTTLTTEAIPAGTTVFIGVGTIARSSATPPIAPYELSVDEVSAPREGSPCLVEASGTTCPLGTTCVSGFRFSAVGRCVRNGTAPNTECRTRGSTDGGVADGGDASADVPDGGVDDRCDPGLVCGPFTFANGECLLRREYGESCDGNGVVCRRLPFFNCQTTPRDPTSGTCVQDGTAVGALCGAGADHACPEGSTCTSDATLAWCATSSAPGDACDPNGRTSVCAAGNSCVRAGTAGAWLCRADGTAPGSACRTDAPRCDPGLSCSSESGPGRCATTLTATTSACDPRWGSQRCAGERACMATSFDEGRCVDVLREEEGDNGHPVIAQAVTLPAMIRGGLRYGSDVDCYAFELPAGARLRAETSNGAGWYANDEDTVLSVRRMNNEVIEINDDMPLAHPALPNACSQVDAAWARSPLRGLPAGRYAVCVSAFRGEAPIGEYHLAITAEQP